jgi:hypothetical protein
MPPRERLIDLAGADPASADDAGEDRADFLQVFLVLDLERG